MSDPFFVFLAFFFSAFCSAFFSALFFFFFFSFFVGAVLVSLHFLERSFCFGQAPLPVCETSSRTFCRTPPTWQSVQGISLDFLKEQESSLSSFSSSLQVRVRIRVEA